ncbi:hypothetical protein FJ872_04825 [Mesorhizobium sp. B2-5-9]|nr:hypothetical protein FJ872_04825 [Mesorhizobium sp. B2-5-9]
MEQGWSHEREIVLGNDSGRFSLLFPPETAAGMAFDPAPHRRGFASRIVSALLSPLRGRRGRLPPQDDYLRRDVGLPEHEMRRDYWEYWWWHQ